MKYGYFDDAAREYVITRPDTPQSWSNYLGSTEYGAIITNNAGGYGFYQSGRAGASCACFSTVSRWTNLVDTCICATARAATTGPRSWQPVGKPLDQYQSTCRHGTAYTIIQSRYDGIASETTYFVPLGQKFEYWRMKVTNESDRPRQLSLFTFCEFTNQWVTTQDQVNLQYSLFIVRGEMTDGLLRIAIHDNLPSNDDAINLRDTPFKCWMTLAGAPLAGYDTSREAFIGPYRAYHNPLVVEKGHCTNSNAFGDNACGSLQADLSLQPGESRELLVMLGIGEARTVGRRTVAEFGSLERAAAELQKLKDDWHARLGSLVVETPDPGSEPYRQCVGALQLPDHLCLVARRQPGLQRRTGWPGLPGFGPGYPGGGGCHPRAGPPDAWN